MAITYNAKEKIFHLQTNKTSYIMQLSQNHILVHIYWGKKIK